MSYKPKILTVSEGGTGVNTLTGVLTGATTANITANAVTANGVLYGGASNAVSSLSAASASTVMVGTSASAPSFSSAPVVTSINLGNTSLSTYLQGTYTPAITGSVSNPTVGYTTQTGSWTKIGNRVFLHVKIELSSISGGSGNLQISVPASPSVPVSQTNVGPCYLDNVTFIGPFVNARTSPTVFTLQGIRSALGSVVVQISDLTSSSKINFSIEYEA